MMLWNGGKRGGDVTRADTDEVRKRTREQKDNSVQAHCQKVHKHTD